MKQYLGNIYLINKFGEQKKISENATPSNITMNAGFNENITKNNNLKNIYQNFMNSLKSLSNNSYDLQNIETIMSYLSLDIIKGISVFIIETSNLNYCLNGKKQLIETDIISSDNISESKKYSFINDAFCKYFKVQNIEYIPKGFLFVNKEINQKRNIFVCCQNQNCLLKVSNYINNSFNLIRIANPDQNPYKMIKNSFNAQQIFNRKSFNPNTKNNFIAVRFCSNDQSINYPIACKDSDIFIRLEEKLLLECPKLMDKNIFYTVNTNIIN
jgi:hypothetical protein